MAEPVASRPLPCAAAWHAAIPAIRHSQTRSARRHHSRNGIDPSLSPAISQHWLLFAAMIMPTKNQMRMVCICNCNSDMMSTTIDTLSQHKEIKREQMRACHHAGHSGQCCADHGAGSDHAVCFFAFDPEPQRPGHGDSGEYAGARIGLVLAGCAALGLADRLAWTPTGAGYRIAG